jgi:hypothetical protein
MNSQNVRKSLCTSSRRNLSPQVLSWGPESGYFHPAFGGMDPGACPGPDRGFAGVTTQETFYKVITLGPLEGPIFLPMDFNQPLLFLLYPPPPGLQGIFPVFSIIPLPSVSYQRWREHPMTRRGTSLPRGSVIGGLRKGGCGAGMRCRKDSPAIFSYVHLNEAVLYKLRFCRDGQDPLWGQAAGRFISF